MPHTTRTHFAYLIRIQNRPLLLEHIVVSPAFEPCITNGAVCHREYDAHVDANGSWDTLADATCGDVPSGSLRLLKDCLAVN